MTNDRASFSEMLEHYQTTSITTHTIIFSYSLQMETHISLQDKYLKLYRNASKASCYTSTTSGPSSVFFVKTLPLSLNSSQLNAQNFCIWKHNWDPLTTIHMNDLAYRIYVMHYLRSPQPHWWRLKLSSTSIYESTCWYERILKWLKLTQKRSSYRSRRDEENCITKFFRPYL